jgi:tRNA(Ile)-lysidine synthase
MRGLILAVLPSGCERGPLAIACSGGPDSLALAILAAQAFPGCVEALIVDHGLRPDSADEAAQTQRWLTARNIPAHVLVWEGQKPAAGIQAAAREARYALLLQGCERIGASCLLLAHHLDDQAETFLLALGRGAGLQGLAAMAPSRTLHGVTILRPLLTVPKSRLVATLSVLGQSFIDDRSNADPRFDRARLRQQMGALAAAGLTPELLVGAAARLSDARDVISCLVDEALRHVWSAHGSDQRLALVHVRQMLGCEPGQRQVIVPLLASLIQKVSGARPRFEELYRLVSWLASCATAGTEASPRTLGKCRISLREGQIIIEPE